MLPLLDVRPVRFVRHVSLFVEFVFSPGSVSVHGPGLARRPVHGLPVGTRTNIRGHGSETPISRSGARLIGPLPGPVRRNIFEGSENPSGNSVSVLPPPDSRYGRRPV